MKNIDIENFYKKIAGRTSLIAAYTERPVLEKIIRACRLKPHSVFMDNFRFTTKLENHWVDEFGNSAYIDSTEIKIKLNDLNIHTNSKTSTDLFYGSSVRTTAQKSKFALIASGKFVNDNILIASFYGNDEYIRTFLYNNTWSKVSPLIIGFDALSVFFNNINYQWNEIKPDFGGMLKIDKCITTAWPTKRDIVSYFDNITIKEILVDGQR